MTSAQPPAQPVARPPAQPVARQIGPPAQQDSGVAPGQTKSRPARRESGLLKGASPLQFGPRLSADELRYSLAHRLTPRDRDLLHALARLGVLTAPQVAQAFFQTECRARKRLVELVRLGVLGRFRPHRESWGSHPYHYVLAPAGAAVVAADRGDDPARTRKRLLASRVIALSRTQRLQHLVGVNGVWAALTGRARREEAADLALWVGEARCAAWTKGIVHPDAYLEWSAGSHAVECFVEFDRGTERLHRLTAKLAGYERFEAERGAAAWVLFAFISARREATARRALAGATVPLATAALCDGQTAAGAAWAPIDRNERMRLEELARLPLPAGSRSRVAEGRGRGWRFDRSRFDDNEEAPIDMS